MELNITKDNFITDDKTNTVYFSSLIDKLSGGFEVKDGSELRKALLNALGGINHEELVNTKDVWARDYMPVQLTSDLYLDYTYSPDYLNGIEECRTNWVLHNVHTTKHQNLDLVTLRCPLILDGGNIIKVLDKNLQPTIIMCDKVLKENAITEPMFRGWWNVFFQNKIELILVKWEGEDLNPIGHIDGMMRYIAPGKILVTNYCDLGDRHRLVAPLKDKFEVVELHFKDNVGKGNSKLWQLMIDHSWGYINFLQVGHHIIIPSLGWEELDNEALAQIRNAFGSEYSVELIGFDMTNILGNKDMEKNSGGALNCLTWTVEL